MTMNTIEPRMTHLFEQLGLESSDEAIAKFIQQHPLDAKTYISEAPFWTPAQRALIAEKIISDDNWAIIVDQLNQALHTCC